jgi:Protein of unknown function (DUF3341)
MTQRTSPCTVFGLLPPEAPIEPLLAELRSAGLTDNRLTVTSALPLPNSVFQDRVSRPPLHLTTIAAGLLGISVGLFFAGGTAAIYPIPTGGKPIVALPVLAIISYETMMLFAIVSTFVGLLLRLRRLHKYSIPHDPRIHVGYTGLVLRADEREPSPAILVHLLERGGAVEVRSV